GSHLAATLHKSQYGILVGAAAATLGFTLLAADEGLVSLHDATAAGATHRSKSAATHRFPDPMGQEPRGLISDLQNAVELVRADALLTAAEQVHGLHRLVE